MNRRTLRPVLVAVVIFAILFSVVGTLLIRSSQQSSLQTPGVTQPTLSGIDAVSIAAAKRIVSGDLQVVGGVSGAAVTIASSSELTRSSGQLYVTNNKELHYFDGIVDTNLSAVNTLTSDIASLKAALTIQAQQLAATPAGVVSLQGQTGNVVLTGSDGVAIDGTNVTNTGVLTVQGMAGNVTLTAGYGVTVTGTVIANTGVTGLGGATGNISVGNGLDIVGGALANTGVVRLVSGSSSLLISDNGSGVYTIREAGSGSGGAVALGPTAAQVDAANNSSVWINKTGTGNLLQLSTGASPVDRFVVDSSGAILNGTISFNQITGTPGFVTSMGGAIGNVLLGPGLLLSGQTISSTGVLSVGGLSGAVSLGSGLAVVGGQLVATTSGVGSITGTPNQITVTGTGNVTLSLPQNIAVGSTPTFAGLSLSTALPVGQGGTGTRSLTQNGIIVGQGSSAVSAVTATGTGQCLVSTAGAPVFQTCPGSGGVASVNGGSGAITIAGMAASSVLTSGSTITLQDASATVKGLASFNAANLSVSAGVVNTVQNIAVSSTPTFAGLNLTSALGITNGGTGTTNLAQNGVVVGQGTAGLSSVIGSAGQCLVSTAGAPVFQSCPGSGGVASVNGGTGAVTIASTTASSILTAGNTITIQDASATTKGLASFSSTNFTVSGGVVNTAQNINTSATPTFAGLNLTTALSVTNGGTGATTAPNARTNLGAAARGANGDITSLTGLASIAPTSALTIGVVGQNLLLQGLNTTLSANASGFSSNLTFVSPTANVTYRLQAAAAGTYDVCTTAGNCVGVGGGVTSPGGTIGKLSKFISGSAIGDSIITDNGTSVSIAGVLNVNTITPTAAAIIGATTQSLSLQGSNTTLSSTNAGITNSLSFALPSGTNKSIVIPNASGTVAISANGPLSLDANGNLTCPSCLTSGGGGGSAGVSSLNGATGSLTLTAIDAASVLTAGTTLTIQNASTDTKGLASFSASNFTVTNGAVNTIQNIAVNASPTFAGLNITANIAATGTVTAGAFSGNGSAVTDVDAAKLGGNSSNYYTNATNISAGTLADARLSSAVTLQGNTFNGASQLVQLTAGGILPVLSGANLTALNASNLSSGTIANARLTTSVSLLGQTISNSELENSNITVVAGTGLSGGGAVVLGGTVSLANTGVLSVIGTTDQIIVSGSTGDITFSLPQSIATTSSPTFASLNLTTALSLANGGTGATSAVDARANIGAAVSGANGDITALSGLTTALSIAQGGTGTTSFTQNGVVIGQGASGLATLSASGAGQCLVSTAGAPIFQSCPGAGGVSSVNGANGALTVTGNSAGSILTVGNTITLQDASATIKGLASFNSSNFVVTNGNVNTIQGISTTSSPLFTALSLTTALAVVNGGTGLSAVPNNGQLLIGNGTGYSLNALTGGTGITVTNGAGGITISAPGSGACALCANQSLSNLSNVAINTDLTPSSNNAINLGSSSLAFRDGFLAGILQVGSLDAGSASALVIGATNATSIKLQQDTVVATGKTLIVGTGASYVSYSGASFVDAVQYATSGKVSSVVATDVNADGKADIIAANDNSTVSVLLGNGNATFATKLDYPSSASVRSLTTADVNGDNKKDIITANYGLSSVSVLLGDGLGGFANKVDYVSGSNPYSLTTADVNGDNKQDIITANRWSNDVSVLLGDGLGGFAAKVDYASGLEPRSVTTADVNGDNKKDIITANYGSSSVSVLLGDGLGGFAAKVDYASGLEPRSVTTADVNGDYIQDIITANNSATVSVLIGNGNGFASKADYSNSNGYSAAAVTTTDVNEDAKPDLITVSDSDSSGPVTVMLNDGTGNFGRMTSYTSYFYPGAVTTADLNADGKQDIIAASGNSSAVSVLVNSTSSALSVAANISTVASGSTKAALILQAAAGQTVDIFRVQNSTGSAALLNVSANGNVGIGTTIPTQKLDVNGNISARGDLYVGSAKRIDSSGNLTNINTITASGDALFKSAVDSATAFQVQDATSTSIFNVDTAGKKVNIGVAATYNVYSYNTGTGLSAVMEYPTGGSINDVVAGDVNGDSRPDVIGADPGLNVVSVMLGNSDGTLAPKVDYPVDAYPNGVVVADTNADGKLDIISVNYTGSSISVLINNGNGTFAAQVVYAVGTQPRGITVGDINGDSKPDVITADLTSSYVSVLLGNGDGTFATKVSYPVPNPYGITVADVNGDSKVDILTVNRYDNIASVLINSGDGTFATKVDYPTGVNPVKVIVADVNGDGKPDMIVANQNSSSASVYLNNGDGTFATKVDYTVSNNVSSIAAMDLNNDGKIDIVTGNLSATRGVAVFLGNGDGTFGLRTIYSAGTDVSGVTITDLNTDGKVDIIVGKGGPSGIAVLLNGFVLQTDVITSGTSISSPSNLQTALTVQGSAGQTADIFRIQDATGAVLMTVAPNGNIGIGGPVSATNKLFVTGSIGASSIYQQGNKVCDMSNNCGYAKTSADGSMTVKTTTDSATAFQVQNSVGATALAVDTTTMTTTVQKLAASSITVGTPATYTTHAPGATFAAKVDYATGASPYGVTTADVNGDGTADIITANYTSSTTSVLLSNGNGTFAANVDYPTDSGPFGVITTDVNGDSKADIITANYGSNTTSVLLNNGNGTFAAKVDYATDSGPFGVITTDVNGDNKADIITANNGSNTTSVLLNNGTGTFAAKVDYATGVGTYGVTTADVNGDNKADIITANNGSNTTSVLLNNGNGTFAAKVDYATGIGPTSVTTTDVNGDSKADIITANNGSNTTSVLIGTGNGTFAAKVDYPTGFGLYGVTTADVNGDSKADIITANYSSNTTSVLINGASLLTVSSTMSATSSSSDKSALILQAAAGQTADVFRIQDASATNVLFNVSATGNVGIGVGSPTQKLDVNGNINARGDLYVGSTKRIDSSGNLTNINTITASGDALFKSAVNSATAFQVQNSTGTNILSVDTAGKKVNIGVAATYNVYSYNTGSAFADKVEYTTGNAPVGVAGADFNGDGRDDAAVVSKYSNTISILLSNSNGTLLPKVDYPTGSSPRGIASGDVDADGNIDLVVSNADSRTVSVLLGNGDGTFKTRADYTMGDGANGLALADLNGDNKLDIAVANATSYSVAVLLNNGDGTFQAYVAYNAGIYPNSVTAIDFNGDGFIDLAAANSANSGTVSIFMNNGDGTFRPQVEYSVGDAPRSISSADLNGDNKPDLVIANSNEGAVAVLLNNGNGTFQARNIYGLSNYGGTVFAVDLNADGIVDIAATSRSPFGASTQYVDILYGNGDGTFQAKVSYNITSSATGNHAFIAVADFNGDGKPDLAVTAEDTDKLAILLNGLSLQTDIITSGTSISSPSNLQAALVVQGSAGQTADIFRVQNATGDGLLSVAASGNIGIGQAASTMYKLSIAGSVNASSLYQQGNKVCDMSNNCGYAKTSADGSMTVKTTTDSATAFQVQDSTGVSALTVDTTTSTVTVKKLVADTITLVGGITSARPASPTEGMLFFDTTTKQLILYANGKWQADRSASTYIVSAMNSVNKNGADYTADGNTAAASDGDQIQINQALVAAGAAGGGKVYLMEGTYTIDASVSIPNNVALVGAGAGTIITLPSGFGTSTNMVVNTDIVSGTNVTISDLMIDGNRMNIAPGSYNGIYLNNMGGGTGSGARDGARISNITVSGIRYNGDGQGAGISLDSSNNNTINGNTINRTGYSGFSALSSNNNSIFGNNIHDQTSGIVFYSSNNNTVNGNIIQRYMGGNGIALWSDASGNTITANIFHDGSSGMFIGGSNNTITGNTITNNSNSGIQVYVSNNNVISSNKIHDNGDASANEGITIYRADFNTIIGNDISDTSATTTNYAIDINENDSNGNYLADNRFSSPSTINDLGTGTIYANQINATGQIINSASGGFATKLQSGSSTDLFQGQDALGNTLMKVTSTGILQSAGLDTVTTSALNIGTTNATAINLQQNTVVAAGKTLSVGAAASYTTYIPGASLATKVDYAVGTSPYSITTADVNGDSKVDIMTVNSVANTISVLMGNGNGVFATKVDYPTGTSPYGITTADVNGDGKTDIITANRNSDVSVLINNGNGTFATKISYAVGVTTYGISVADVNGDSKIDIITASSYSDTVSVLINNGNGTFATKVDYAIGGDPFSVTTADVNGDGKIDIISANRSSYTASILINNGNGTFATKVDYATGTYPQTVTTTDVNGDSKIDIITANNYLGTASVLINNGNGTFATKVDYPTGTGAYGVTAADINGDGVADIITSNAGANTISVLIGNGNGTFATKVDYISGSSPYSVIAADINSDGKVDIITANNTANSVSVLINGASLLAVSSTVSASAASSDKAALILQAAAGQTADIFRVQNATDMTPYFNVAANGNVGIGVMSPTQKLDVNGNINARGDLYVGSAKRIDSSGNLININNITATGSALFKTTTNSATAFQVQDSVGATALAVDTTTSTVTVKKLVADTITLVGGITSARPASPTEGMLFFDTTTKKLLVYANGKWQADRSSNTVTVGTSAVGGSTAAAASKGFDGADFVNISTTSAQTVINAAIATLPATGGSVYLMEGTYVIDGSISLPNNVSLIGAGNGTVIKLSVGSNATIDMIKNTDTVTGTGIVIKDMRIYGHGWAPMISQSAISLTGMGGGTGASSRIGAKISNVTMINIGASSIYLNNSDNNTITDTITSGSGRASIRLYLSDFNTLSGNVVSNIDDGGGISLATSSNNTLLGNTVQDNYEGGISLAASSNNNIVSGNKLHGNVGGYGEDINISSSNNNVATGNNLENGKISVYLSNNNVVSSNKIHDAGDTTNNNAIYITDSDANTITGNNITDSSATTTNYAITITTAASDANYLADNRFSSPSTINNLGTGTIYANQLNTAGQLVNSGAGGLVTKLQVGSSADLFQAQDAAGTVVLRVSNTGALNVSTNSTAAFKVQDSTGTGLLVADTTTMTVTVQNLVVSTTLTVNGHIISGGTVPTVAAAAAACTTPTVTIAGTDTAGTVTVTTGTGCSAAGAMATVTFNTAYANAPRITLTPRNALSAAIGSFNGTVDTTTFTLDSSVTLAGATTYVFNYIIVQ